ncbi:MAG: hypothetical protein QW178_05680 [Candidatus Nitrosocaldus sp.]
MVEVLVDTSFIIAMANMPIKGMDRLEVKLGRVEFLIPDIVVRELERIALDAGVKRAKEAKAALQLINDARLRFRMRMVDIGKVSDAEGKGISKVGKVDDLIVGYAESAGCYVATLDREMIKRLRGRCAGIITLHDDTLTIV